MGEAVEMGTKKDAEGVGIFDKLSFEMPELEPSHHFLSKVESYSMSSFVWLSR